MRWLGLFAMDVGVLALGLALLRGLGLVRTPRAALVLSGLALVTGWALTGIATALGAIAGLSMAVWQVAVFWALAAAAALLATRRVAAAEPGPVPTESTRRGRLTAVGGALVLAGYLAALLARSVLPLGTMNTDVWNQWLPKAQILYWFGGLDTGPGGWTAQANADYPPLDPALEATTFRFLGEVDPLALPLQHWVVAAAFFAALAALLRPHVRPAVLWPSLAALALAPRLGDLVGSSLADEPLALFVGLAGVAGTLWLRERDGRFAVLAGVFLAAAPLTKNEGLLLALALAAVLAVLSRRRGALALLAVPVLAYLPWRLWLATHDLPPNFAYDLGRVLEPGELAGRVDQVAYGGGSLVLKLFSPSEWLLLVPLLLVAALAARSRPAVLAVSFAAVVLVGYSAIYWLGNGICTWKLGEPCVGTWEDIRWLVEPSDERIVAPIAVLLGSLLPLVLHEALERTRPRR